MVALSLSSTLRGQFQRDAHFIAATKAAWNASSTGPVGEREVTIILTTNEPFDGSLLKLRLAYSVGALRVRCSGEAGENKYKYAQFQYEDHIFHPLGLWGY